MEDSTTVRPGTNMELGTHLLCPSQLQGLLLMVMSCVTSLSFMVLITTQGVCGQQWSVTYQPESICAFEGQSVDMSCSYTYPSGLYNIQAYWTKVHFRKLHSDRNYNTRIHVDCSRVGRCQLRMNSLTTSDTGLYYCRITTQTEGQKWIGQPGVQLDVRDAPQTPFVSISPSGDIVEGTNVTLTCSSRSDLPVQKCSWYKTGSHVALQQQSSYTYTMYNIKPIHSGQYYCQIRYECGYTGSYLFNLEVSYLPKNTHIVINQLGDITAGNPVTLTCMSEADPPVHTYTWIKKSGAVELKSGKENTLTFSKIRSEDSGEYLCRAANRIGQQNSSAVSVKVLYHPKNTTVKSSASGEITAGNPVTLTCMSEAAPPVHTYTWIKKSGAVELKSGKDNTLTFSQISSEDSGEYLCRAANRIGKQDSPAVSVQVLYAPQNTTVLFSESGVIVKGTSVTLTCSSDANPPVESYTWFKVNESTAVGSGQQYSITNISSEDGGQYYCEARNKYGAENSTTVSITVTREQSPLVTAVVVVSVCGVVGLLCVLVWLRQMKRSQEPGGQDQHYFSVTGQSTAAEDAGGAEDAGHYSTIQPHGSTHTAGAQGDEVLYASVQFKKAGAAKGSPVQPEGEPSPIYSSVQPRVDNSVVYSGVQPRGI
ncbi:B-cell receptor CD22-like [Alosa sapidissima]|uniref:B-cell receptor CD22-like n=1 Tax=Alosa sapidissima TaxID=34773 RepID=UPI001C09FFDE|nr:B-cell receptor CD22-like [Alosa sapidissima]